MIEYLPFAEDLPVYLVMEFVAIIKIGKCTFLPAYRLRRRLSLRLRYRLRLSLRRKLRRILKLGLVLGLILD